MMLFKTFMRLLPALALLFSLCAWSKRGNKSRQELCETRLMERVGQLEKDFKTRIASAKRTLHDNKHLKAHTSKEAKKFSKRGKAVAQYDPNINSGAVERTALAMGMPYKHSPSTTYFFYKSDKIVGYDNGRPTYWVRAELTSGDVYHGHPIALERVRKYIPTADR